jgi:ribosome biogenesis GTPase
VTDRDKRKVRVSFRKNRTARPRRNDWTRALENDAADAVGSERLSGKGDLTRRRTIVTADGDASSTSRDIELEGCRAGRVMSSVGANRAIVVFDDSSRCNCTLRRVLRTMSRDARNILVAGDRVLVRISQPGEGVIERIEPRTSVISRSMGRYAQIITANVDQAIVVVSADDPPLKLGVIDRFLVGAEKGGVRGIVCINKADLVNPALLQPIAGQYARMGYDVLLASAKRGLGIKAIRECLAGCQTVIAGQSGVGKSSLLNAIQPGLNRPTRTVSNETRKGSHTTRVAQLIALDGGGWVVDTPGFRKLGLWDVAKEELDGLFIEFRPYLARCRLPSCTHIHERDCEVKRAVELGNISPLRYDSFVRMYQSDQIGVDRD